MNRFSFCAFLCAACFLIACGDGSSNDKSSSRVKSNSRSPNETVASQPSSVKPRSSSVAQITVDPSTVTKGSIKDSRDGQSYKTVTIGSQTWMAKNLNYKTANSSCFRDKVSNCNKFGRLYTWDAATAACPSGWHLPTKAEYETLFAAVGGESTAGIKLKSTSGWRNGDNGTGEYSFSALPAVYKSFNEGFFAFFWSSTEYSDDEAYYMKLFYDYDGVFLYYDEKSVLKSVRCIKD